VETVTTQGFGLFDFFLRVLAAIAIVLFGRWLARLARRAVERGLTKVALTETINMLALRSTYYGVIFFAILVALAVLGVPTTGIVGALGVVIIIIGIAFQESLSSFAATIVFLMFQPFKVGELIESNGVIGTVREIALFHTILTRADNRLVNLPNAQIQNSVLTNYSRLGKLRADMNFRIDYATDLRTVRQILQEVVTGDPRLLPESPLAIVVQELAEDYVVMAVRPWVRNTDYWQFMADIQELVKLRFDEEGIRFPYSQQDVHIQQRAAAPVGRSS
jgi:small conductance mechanosensitive channel